MAIFPACFPRCSSIVLGKTLQLAGAGGAPGFSLWGATKPVLGGRAASGFCSQDFLRFLLLAEAVVGGKHPFYSKETAWCLVVDGGTVMGSLFASANRVLVLIEKGKKKTKQPRKKQKHTKKNFQFVCCGAACRFPPTHGSCSLGLPLALFLLQRTQWYGCPPLGRMAFTAKIS